MKPRRATPILAALAIAVPIAGAAVWLGEPDEVTIPTVPSGVPPTDGTPTPAGQSEAGQETAAETAEGEATDGDATDPHPSKRMPPAERAQLLAAVDEIEDEVPEEVLAAEGRVLFRSSDVAKDGESCQACHTDGGANAELGMIPHTGSDFIGPRESQALWNVRDTAPFRWEGLVPTLEEMAGNTIEAHFKAEHKVDVPRKTAALVAYMSTLDAPLTAYDRGRMSAAALRGQALFDGKAGCVACHAGPLFTDNAFHVTGVPKMDPGDTDNGAVRPPGAFNTQQLRDVANTAPYMHNGKFDTLHEVVEFYDEDSALAPLYLTPQEIDDLVEFMRAL